MGLNRRLISTGGEDALDILGDGSCYALWTFNDTYDEVSGNYNGTENGNGNFVTGKEGSAYEVPTNTSAIITTAADMEWYGSNAGTLSFWYKSSGTGYHEIIKGNAIGGGEISTIGIGNATSNLANEQIVVSCDIDGSSLLFYGSRGTSTDGTDFKDGNWHHIVLTADNSTKQIYVDKVSQTVDLGFTVFGSSFANEFFFRDFQFGTPYTNFDGYVIDHCRLFNKVLNQTEINTIYAEI